MNSDLLLKLASAAAILGGTITGILKLGGGFWKEKINNDTVKRKEITDLLKDLYDKGQEDMATLRKEHKDEIEKLKIQHSQELEQIRHEYKVEMDRKENAYLEESRKRDIIIRELIARLPRESREAVQALITELNLEKIN